MKLRKLFSKFIIGFGKHLPKGSMSPKGFTGPLGSVSPSYPTYSLSPKKK